MRYFLLAKTDFFPLIQGSSPRTPGKDNAADDTATENPSVTTHTKTTLDDLLDTLKQLEEPVRVPSPEMKKAKGPAWCKH